MNTGNEQTDNAAIIEQIKELLAQVGKLAEIANMKGVINVFLLDDWQKPTKDIAFSYTGGCGFLPGILAANDTIICESLETVAKINNMKKSQLLQMLNDGLTRSMVSAAVKESTEQNKESTEQN